MVFSRRELGVLAARSAPLYERPAGSGQNSVLPDKLPAPVATPEQLQAPWLGCLAAALDYLLSRPRTGDDDGDDDLFDRDNPLPFEEITGDFARWAAAELARRGGQGLMLLSPSARLAMQRHLHQHINRLTAGVLFHEFSLYKAFERVYSPFSFTYANLSGSHYQRFVNSMRAGKLKDFFVEYAVLARLLGTLLHNRLSAKELFLARLLRDKPEIEALAGTSLESVTGLDDTLSDPHNGGQQVTAVYFGDRAVIYKPRPVEMEAAYNSFLEWFNRKSSAPLRRITVLAKEGYGWVEAVKHQPCKNDEEVRQFFRNSGVQLALLHLLCGIDAHHENIIADGIHPVHVDLEALMQPQGKIYGTGESASCLASGILDDSVLRTGLLPFMETGGNVSYDISGLSSLRDFLRIDFLQEEWQEINTDDMRPVQVKKPSSEQRYNLPKLNGEEVCPGLFTEEIIAGFRSAYQLLQNNRSTLLDRKESPLNVFCGKRSRYVFRSTRFYYALQKESRQAKYLRDGLERSLLLEKLARAFNAAENEEFYPVLSWEHRALENLDIPYFLTNTEETALYLDAHNRVPHLFRRSAMGEARKRLTGFSAEECNRQCGYIRASFLCAGSGGSHIGQNARQGDAVPVNNDREISFREEKCLLHAEAIGRHIAKMALYGADGSVSWLGPVYSERYQCFRFGTLPAGIYSGISGLLLLYAALETVSADRLFSSLTDKIGATLEKYGNFLLENPQKKESIGGISGIGSILYALTKAYSLTGRQEMLRRASMFAAVITPERIAADTSSDIIGGAAGALSALISYLQAGGDKKALDMASLCGEHLLRRRIVDKNGNSWRAFADSPPCSGFSHGASGVIYALARLNALRPLPGADEAVAAGLAFERSLFDAEEQNWWDDENRVLIGSTWCHGAPGIGLARSGLLEFYPDREIESEMERAMTVCRQYDIRVNDHLCCGNLGVADCLLTAGMRASRRDWIDHARRIAAMVPERAEERGEFSFSAGKASVYPLTFFQGYPGMAYQLLRFTRPDVIASVLLLD
ncbi:MAG: hypothetical protein CSB24_02315 [Deltaproteobacteria bacterium]|nr:MAG: hypothetical protein CSB24_02315 [Deltaproteobacteria bacterium]